LRLRLRLAISVAIGQQRSYAMPEEQEEAGSVQLEVAQEIGIAVNATPDYVGTSSPSDIC
jgi:hypothetical protein